MKTLNLSSTKIRLTFWYVGVLALILSLFSVATYFVFRTVLIRQTDETLTEIAQSFENTAILELEDEENRVDSDVVDQAVRDATVEVSFKNYKIFVFSADKRLVSESNPLTLEGAAQKATAQELLARFTANREASRDKYVDGDDWLRAHFHPFKIQGKELYLIVIHPLEETEELLERVRYAFLITIPLALLLASVGGYLLMRKSFAPIAEMNEKAEEITARNLFERLPVDQEDDELGRLAGTFNRLLERLNASFEQQQRFMADASHELRTPVAIVRGEAEVSLTKPDRASSEYRETIEIIEKEAERMSTIVEDLFTLARADAGENSISRTPLYIEDILSDCVKSFRSIGSKRGVEILLSTEVEMPLVADEHLLMRLFANLLDNAVKHAGSIVKIDASIEEGEYKIDISDDGKGIPPENQPHIFERFYRVSKVRSRQKDSQTGSGAGLGLAISKWIVEVHDGTLELKESTEAGTTFSARFPAT